MKIYLYQIIYCNFILISKTYKINSNLIALYKRMGGYQINLLVSKWIAMSTEQDIGNSFYSTEVSISTKSQMSKFRQLSGFFKILFKEGAG